MSKGERDGGGTVSLKAAIESATEEVRRSPPWLKAIYEHNRAVSDRQRADVEETVRKPARVVG